MKLKFFIAGAAIVAGLASAVSCQDLSKDLTALQNKVNSLEATVQGLQAKIEGGAVITSVTPTNSGIVIVLSNGNKYEITNGTNGKDGKDGKDGAAGSVVTIGANGNWFIDGEDTGMPAAGQDGTPGEYYVPNPETGCFDKYSWDAEKGEYVKTPTTISFLAPGTITAVYDTTTGALTLFGVVDEKGKEIEGGVVITPGSGASEPAGEMTIINTGSYLSDGYGSVTPGVVTPTLVAVTEQTTNFFGLDFTAGEETIEPVKAYIRVSPKDAVLTTEDVYFENSKGEKLPFVKAFAVEKQDDAPITKAEAATSAIWKVSYGIDMDTYVATDFANAIYLTTTPAIQRIAFALKAGDAATDYNFTFNTPTAAATSYVLDYFVDKKAAATDGVSNLKNRYGVFTGTTEYAWKVPSATAPVMNTPTIKEKIVTTGTGVNVDDAGSLVATDVRYDARSTKAKYPAVVGKEITIYVGSFATAFVEDKNVKAVYVELDKAYCDPADPSELAAWKSYEPKIAGLNTVQMGNVAKITINDEAANGDEIGFRVWAVNHNGTLVDPDGRAFYVQVGTEGVDWDGVTASLAKMKDYTDFNTNNYIETDITTKALVGTANKYTFEMSSTNPTVKYNNATATGVSAAPEYTIEFLNKPTSGATTTVAGPFSVGTGAAGSFALTAAQIASINKVRIAPVYDAAATAALSGNLWQFADGQDYNGTFKVLDATGHVLATLATTFNKAIPTDYPASFSPKTGQISPEKVYNAYPTPAAGASPTAPAATGSVDVMNIFNFPGGNPTGFAIEFTNIVDESTTLTPKWTGSTTLTPSLPLTGNVVTVPAALIANSDVNHAMKVAYDYGQISSAEVKLPTPGGLATVNAYKAPIDSYTIVYNDIYLDGKYSWDWKWGTNTSTTYAYTTAFTTWITAGYAKNVADAKPAENQKPLVVYSKFTSANGCYLDPAYIQGKSLFDADYSKTLKDADAAVAGKIFAIDITGVKLFTANTEVEEYFNASWADTATLGYDNVEFTAVSGASNPTADVDSKLVITCKDVFGKTFKITLDVVVMRNI